MSRIHHHALRLWSTPLSWSLGKGVEHYSAPYASFAPAVAARIDRLSPPKDLLDVMQFGI